MRANVDEKVPPKPRVRAGVKRARVGVRHNLGLSVAALQDAVLPPHILHLGRFVCAQPVVKLVDVQPTGQAREINDIGLSERGIVP